MHDRSRASGSKQIKIGETRSCANKTSLSENLCPESIHSETVVTENVLLKNQSKSDEGMSDVCTTRIIAETLASMADVVIESNVENLSSLAENVKNTASVPCKFNVDRCMKQSRFTGLILRLVL